MKKILTFCAAVLVALAASAGVVNIAPDSPNAAGDNLRRAIRDAQAGDVIVLADGVYKEADQIALDKDITIQAAENAEPVIAIHWYCTLVNSAKVVFKGVTFAGNEMLYLKDDGVTPMGASDHCIRPYDNSEGKSLTFENCEFVGFPSYIIYPQRGDRCIDAIVMKNCYFHDNVRSAIAVGYDSSHGTNVACNSVKIENSTFANFTDVQEALLSIKNDGQETDNIELVVDHCTFYNFVKNTTGDYSFIDCRKSTNVAISNCIFAQPAAEMSKATYVYGGSIDNCLIYNTNGHRSNSIVHNGIEGDPKFVDAANGNYTLGAESPALAAGKDGSNLGDPRWWPTAVVEPEYRTIYCKVEYDWWNWDYSNPTAVCAHAWGKGIEDTTWPGILMTKVEGEEFIWKVELDTRYANILFTRCNAAGNDYKGVKTSDLTIPTDGKNMYIITKSARDWEHDPEALSESDGEWGTYTPASYTLENGFYLVGKFGGVDAWNVEDLSAAKMFVWNKTVGEDNDEWKIMVDLAEGDKVKACYVYQDKITAYIPDGEGNEYVVDANHAGNGKTIYFQQLYNNEWGGHFYIDINSTALNNTDAAVKSVKILENGQMVLMYKGTKYNVQGAVVK